MTPTASVRDEPRVTSTSYERPYRPRPIALANAIGRRLGASVSLAPDDLLRAAEARVPGATDFGDPRFREPLAVLSRSLDEEARLTPIGRWLVRERVVGLLANRLRVERALARRPDVRDVALAPLTVIVGLQRTGTTLLHRLMSADPARRWLASWEALHPVPLDPRAPLSAAPRDRMARARMAERALAYLAPDFFAVHPIDAEQAEEDVLLLDLSLRSTVSEATLSVPSYSRWLEENDQRPAYEGLAMLLRLLSAQRGTRRWLLKTPHHLEHLDVLFDVFPDARVVWTHRDPAVAVPSFASMVAHGRGVFSDAVDPREVGSEWLRKTARLVSRAMETRSRKERAFVDVRYEDLVADPIREVRRVYDALGDRFTPDLERRMRAVLDAHPQHKHGHHRYRAEDFGLDEERVRARFAPYLARFSLLKNRP